ncbi:MAG: hypothetical protein WAM86_04520 [Candidatus Sulfotelmatobacter sp.]
MRSARRVSIGTPAVGIVLFALCLQAVGQVPVQIQIRVLNAKNGERVANQKVSVGIKGVKGATEYTTDAEGDINVNLPPEAEVFAATEWWTTCRKMESGVDPYVPVSKVFQDGVTVPNSCGKAKSETIKGKLVIFAEKSSLWKLFQK